MNNGKVRIYELSKELNLENKDILAICDQLQIAYKSHSSTITEAEAESIRSAAHTYSTAHTSPSKAAPVRKSSAPIVESRNSTPLNSQKKQQILEIRRPTNRMEVLAEKPELLGPPTTQAPITSSPLEVPVVATPTEDDTPSASVTSSESASPIAVAKPAEAVKSAAQELKTPQRSEPIAPSKSPAVTEGAPPSPVSPPVAPAAKSPETKPAAAKTTASQTTPRPVLQSKPVLRSPAKAGSSEKAGTATQKAPTADQPKRSGDRKVPAPVKPAQAPSRPQIVELKRPKPVSAESESSGGDQPSAKEQLVLLKNRPSRPAADGTTTPGPVELLAKPTPPKARRKEWEDENEEEIPEKTAKLAAKGKRRTQPRIEEDDDEDLDALLEADANGVTQAQVSLSLARPPKPKSAPTSKPVAASPTTSQPKRRTFNRRDRRDQSSNKQERPEIITLTGGVTVQELAQMMVVSETEIIRHLFMKGIAATVTQTLDVETATMVAEEMGLLVDHAEKESEAKKVTEMLDAHDLENLQRRPPVVTIMGHVDHGKTTLLDSIRKTKVAAGEAGGITQHIGAYHVDVEHNGELQQVVFLDTPGHEAFTAMRARGARVTDIAILVVAADDGVRPQTIEAISHAKAAGVPIVVAINKVDKEQAQPDRVKQELTEFELVPEEWGGNTVMVPVSAMTGQNLDTLLEMILLVSEVEDLYANPNRPARGTVIEANLDKAKGPVATLLVQNGTLRVGDILVAGSALGKVRAMVDDRGRRVKEASPSFAVEVLGLGDVPAAGDEFEVYKDEKDARAVADSRAEAKRQSRLMAAMSSRRVSLNTLSSKAQEGELKELNIVLKADVQGSVEALLGSLKQLPQNEVQVRVLFAAPGEISETDVDLAAASEAVLIGFNTTLATGARQAADRAGVDVREYNIIYNLLDDIQGAMEGLLEPELVEEHLGQLEVRAVFPVGKGAVAGCYVQSGKAIRNCKVRVRRGNQQLYEGNLDSLKRMREDAKEVNAGYECGIGLDSFNAWEVGDIIETYRMITKRRTLSPSK